MHVTQHEGLKSVEISPESVKLDSLRGLVVRVLAKNPEVPVSIAGTTRFSEE
jgi:hypothetical protein